MKKIFYFINGLTLEAFCKGLKAFEEQSSTMDSVGIFKVTEDQFFLSICDKKGLRKSPAVLVCKFHSESKGMLLEADYRIMPRLIDMGLLFAGFICPMILPSSLWLWIAVLLIFVMIVKKQNRRLKQVFLEIPAFLYDNRFGLENGKAGAGDFQ